jgi:DNA-binding transcriptional ArsR family regulator
MANHSPPLDTAFHALSDATRRAVINRLVTGSAPVKDLAKPFNMGLPAFLKHIRVLEDSGLIATEKTGRVRSCRLQPERLAEAKAWLSDQIGVWQAGADRLASYVETQITGDDDT